jgi:hypothetical protein
MRVLERLGENLGALVVSVIVAGFASIGAWLLTIFVGAKFFHDELSYGIPLAFGIPAALVAGVTSFVIVFKKLA